MDTPLDGISSNDTVIAVMGRRNSGKTNFINVLSSGQSEDALKKRDPNRAMGIYLRQHHMVLVEFPELGSNSTTTLPSVVHWLAKAYEKGIRLSGLLYMHPVIKDAKTSRLDSFNSLCADIRIFEELCGPTALAHTTAVITKSDLVANIADETLLEGLPSISTTFFNKVAKTSWFSNSLDSAQLIIRELGGGKRRRPTLLIQEEIVGARKSLSDTSAGRVLLAATGLWGLDNAETDGENSQERDEGEEKRDVTSEKLDTTYTTLARVTAPDWIEDQIFRLAGHDQAREIFAVLKGEEAQLIADYLQTALYACSDNDADRKANLLVSLYILAHSSAVFPQSYLLSPGDVRVENDFNDCLEFGFTRQWPSIAVAPSPAEKSDEESQRWLMLQKRCQEAVLLENLHHPGLLPLYGLCQAQDYTVRVGPSGKGCLLKYLSSSEIRKLPLLLDICETLLYLRQNRIPFSMSELIDSNSRISEHGRALIAGCWPWDGSRPSIFGPVNNAHDVWEFSQFCYWALEGSDYDIFDAADANKGLSPGINAMPGRPENKECTDEVWYMLMSCWASPDKRPTLEKIRELLTRWVGSDTRPGHPVPYNEWARDLRVKADYDVDLQRVEDILLKINPLYSQLLKEGLTTGTFLGGTTFIPRTRTHSSQDPVDKTGSGVSQDQTDDDSGCRMLLSSIIAHESSEDVLKSLKALNREDSQAMADFFASVLCDADLLTEDGKRTLNLLGNIASAAGLYPRCYILDDVTYDEQDSVGEGGFANVFLGHHQGKAVCIKVLKYNDDHTKVKNAYMKELVLWANLKHPNILPFHGVSLVGETSQVGLISPWMQNGDLRTYSERLLPHTRMPLLYDVIKGLSYLHQLGVVHSDLKAANVLISDEGRAVITDFGTSHIATSTQVELQPFTTSHIAYTERWVAPELITMAQEGRRPTKACDIWSFGCLCYEVLSRKDPFYKYGTREGLIAAMKRGETPARPNNASRNCDLIDDWMWEVILVACWNYVYRRRPSAEGLRVVMANKGFEDRRLGSPSLDMGQSKYHGAVQVDLIRVKNILDQVADDL